MTTASAWGFTRTVTGNEWVASIVCRGVDPDMFDVVGHELSPANEAALALCNTCPVRTQCRDDSLTAEYPPVGKVAGGWWWDPNGRGHPHPEDLRLAPAARRTYRLGGRVYNARKAITAARAVAAEGLTVDEASQRVNRPIRAVETAVTVFRYAPDLLTAVWDGDMPMAAAYDEAISRRHNTGSEPRTETPAA